MTIMYKIINNYWMRLSKISWFASGELAETNNRSARQWLSLCTDLPPLRKNLRRGICDSLLLIVYGGHVIVPGMRAKWFDWLLLVDHTASWKWGILIGFRACHQNIDHIHRQLHACSFSDPGISPEKRKESEIFIERFFSRTKKLKALKR